MRWVFSAYWPSRVLSPREHKRQPITDTWDPQPRGWPCDAAVISDQWYEFLWNGVGWCDGYDGCAAGIENPGTSPWTFTVPAGQSVDLLVCDGFNSGDSFTAYDNGNPIVSTPVVAQGTVVDCDPAGCATNPLFSHASVALGAGSHSITIYTDTSPFGGGAAFFKIQVTQASAQVFLLDLEQVYDGAARTITATTMPAGLTVEFTYDGNAWAPTNVGNYAVTGTVDDVMYQGSAADTLTVSKGSQTINFPQLPNQRPTNVVHLAATASSGLPVTFALVSGPASITNGTNVVFSGAGDVTVSASQAGDANWNLASTSQSFRVGSGAILDFDGDGITDLGVYRSSSNFWFAWQSTDGALTPFAFGTSGDIAIPADYDGDGLCDIAVFRPSTATWYIFGSATGAWSPMQYGTSIDLPIPADYDGDGKADFAVLRPTSMRWYIYGSLEEEPMTPFVYGAVGDMPIPADYDGDGLADPAVLRPSTMTWYAYGSTVGPIAPVMFGAPGDRPVPGDYDGDGLIDYGVFRPSNVTWYIYGTTEGPIPPFIYGTYGDVPMIFPRR